MKLVINTQYMEWYGDMETGAASGNGRWKAKGGDTYIFPNRNWLDVDANKALAKELCEKVAYSNDFTEEYVIGWSFEEDDAVVTEEWEGERNFYQNGNGEWLEVYTHKPYVNEHLFSLIEESWVRDSEFKHVEGSYTSYYYTVKDNLRLTAEDAMKYKDAA